MAVFVQSVVIICFKFLFVHGSGPTATLKGSYWLIYQLSVSVTTLRTFNELRSDNIEYTFESE